MGKRLPSLIPLSIVCPVYNEGENVKFLLKELKIHVRVPFEIHFVYDFDNDSTLSVLDKCKSQFDFPIKPLKNTEGCGAAGALKTGLEKATGNAVLVLMADNSDELGIVDQMYQLIEEDGIDVVCGSRYMPGGKQLGGPWLKKMLSRQVGLSLNWLASLPTKDATNSFKMYKKTFLKSISIESRGGFSVGIELVVKAFLSGRKIREIPCVWKHRSEGKSRFRLWKWAPHYLRWYVSAFIKS